MRWPFERFWPAKLFFFCKKVKPDWIQVKSNLRREPTKFEQQRLMRGSNRMFFLLQSDYIAFSRRVGWGAVSFHRVLPASSDSEPLCEKIIIIMVDNSLNEILLQ